MSMTVNVALAKLSNGPSSVELKPSPLDKTHHRWRTVLREDVEAMEIVVAVSDPHSEKNTVACPVVGCFLTRVDCGFRFDSTAPRL